MSSYGKYRKFLYKKYVWVSLKEDKSGVWECRYNRQDNKSHMAFNGAFMAFSRRALIKNLRPLLAEHLNPELKKIRRRLAPNSAGPIHSLDIAARQVGKATLAAERAVESFNRAFPNYKKYRGGQ